MPAALEAAGQFIVEVNARARAKLKQLVHFAGMEILAGARKNARDDGIDCPGRRRALFRASLYLRKPESQVPAVRAAQATLAICKIEYPLEAGLDQRASVHQVKQTSRAPTEGGGGDIDFDQGGVHSATCGR